MNILSLFDGISCAQLALKRAGIPISLYLASELDKYAIAITKKNFPKTVQIGDVRKINCATLPKIDLLIGGSPCTSLSCAARQKESGLEKGESTLFWQYVRILRECSPQWFMLENVASMKKPDRDRISEVLSIQPIMINSALVSAQNRKRLYWTNIPVNGLPQDRGIMLKDILQNGKINKAFNGKSYAITTTYGNSDINDKMYPRTSIATQNKSYCVTATYGHATPKDFLENSQRTMIYALPRGFNKGGMRESAKSQGNRRYDSCGKAATIMAHSTGGNVQPQYKIEETLRKLTPVECERLQTLPDNYTAGISNTQRYRCLGNAFTVDVIVHILQGIKEMQTVPMQKDTVMQLCFSF
jgi:DNA (cytosine-5)-methyltransferase 3A